MSEALLGEGKQPEETCIHLAKEINDLRDVRSFRHFVTDNEGTDHK